MKLLHSSLALAIVAATAVNAAPTQIDESNGNVARLDAIIAKRDNMERALEQLTELHELRRKRQDLDVQLNEREYKVVTEVLLAVKDTELAPKVLEWFASNEKAKTVAADAVIWVVKSGFISLETLLELLVQSGLLNRVLTDVLGNCETYVSVIKIAKNVVDKFLGDLGKRDAEHVGAYTDGEAMELMKKNNMLRPSMLEGYTVTEDKRDLSDILNNVLDSLGKSGLASQVVQTILGDSQFLDFGVDLVKELMHQNLIKVSTLLEAVSQSGLIPDLLKLLLNFDTLKEIGSKAIQAISGQCSAGSSPSSNGGSGGFATTTKSPVSTPTTRLQGGGVLGGIGGIVSGLLGDNDSTTVATTAQATRGAQATNDIPDLGNQQNSVAGQSVTADPCATALAKRDFKRLRLNY